MNVSSGEDAFSKENTIVSVQYGEVERLFTRSHWDFRSSGTRVGWLRVGTDNEMRREDFGRCLAENGSGNP